MSPWPSLQGRHVTSCVEHRAATARVCWYLHAQCSGESRSLLASLTWRRLL
jgi:Ni,Fe-hydrogenase I small subunit